MGDGHYCMQCGSAVQNDYAIRSCPSSGKKVNRTLFAMLALFMGGLGAHRFYSGHLLSGIVYLVLVWTFIPSILGLVECILALIREGDEDGNLTVDPDMFFIRTVLQSMSPVCV